MANLPVLNGREVIRRVKAAGFIEFRQKGSHVTLIKEGHPTIVTVPVHGNKDLRPGTLRNIIKQCGLTVDDFNNLA